MYVCLRIDISFPTKKKKKMQDGEEYAKENGLTFLETSAKSAHNVNELFYEIGTLYIFLKQKLKCLS